MLIPALGWIASAVAILAIGFLTHAHWIWMAGLLGMWRLVAGLCELASHHG